MANLYKVIIVFIMDSKKYIHTIWSLHYADKARRKPNVF